MPEWRVIPSFLAYEASDTGEVRRAFYTRYPKRKRGVMVPQMMNNGYLAIKLSADGIKHRRGMHRLVCEAFHGLPFEGAHAAHHNGIKTDNRPENLYWASASQNEADKVLHGTRRYGDEHPSTKYTGAVVADIRDQWTRMSAGGRAKYGGLKELAAKYGITPSYAWSIAKGQSR